MSPFRTFLVGLLLGLIVVSAYSYLRISALNDELKTTSYDLWLANHDKAKIIQSESTIFSSDKFGISSALLNGKTMQVNQWQFKENIIFEYTVVFENGDLPTRVTFWLFKNIEPKDQVVIDENGDTYPLERNGQYDYIAKNKAKIYWKRSLILLSTGASIDGNTYVHIEITGKQKLTGIYLEEAEQKIIESTKPFEKIADSILF